MFNYLYPFPILNMKRIFFGLLSFVILIHFISAQTGDGSNEILSQETGLSAINYINIEIEGNGFATVEEEVIVNNTIANIFVPLHIDILSISDSKNTLRYELLPKDGRELLIFYLNSPMDKTVRIRYKTQHLTGKSGSIWTLNFIGSATPQYTIVNVKFPANSDIIALRSDIPRYPANLSSTMWLYPQTNEFHFEMEYQTMQTVQPPNGDNISYIYYIILLMVLVILILIVYILVIKRKKPKKLKKAVREEYRKIVEKKDDSLVLGEKKEDNTIKEKNKRKIKESVIKMVDENEKKILDMLEASEDEITQAYIYKTTGIPKSSLSDIIQRLEKRNIIERRKDGRISWIKLKDWVLD